MPYQFATEDQDYSDFAGGRVIYSLPGFPAFPVRLASEIFLRARQFLPGKPRLRLYDPCCGGAYHLAALGFLHGGQIDSILASDVDPRAVELAQRNLNLLTPAGLGQREAEIRRMLAEFGKDSHAEALASLSTLRLSLGARGAILTRVFQANAFDSIALAEGISGQAIDLIISDVPYGLLTGWELPEGAPEGRNHSPIWRLLDSLQSALPTGTLVAIASDKAQKIAHERYRRVDRFQVGKRQVIFLIL